MDWARELVDAGFGVLVFDELHGRVIGGRGRRL